MTVFFEIYKHNLFCSLIIEARGILSTDKIERVIGRVKDGFNIFLGKMVMDNSISGIRCAASLTHHGLLNGLFTMGMENVDLSSVPTQHLVSLTASVIIGIFIENVSGCNLHSILTSLKCDQVIITNQSLGREETRALVQAMESRVEEIRLSGLAALDIKALTEYRGLGKCWKVRLCTGYTKKRYSEDLSKWARSKNWIEDSSVKKICNFWNFTRPGPDEMLMFLASQL